MTSASPTCCSRARAPTKVVTNRSRDNPGYRRRVRDIVMKQLSAETVRLLSSAQVASSVWSVVKELLENSLDAHATSVEIKLENYGFDKIEVRDNGDGVRSEDTQFMAVRHYTSKISSHEDLEDIATYGFRGEGLGSICAVAEVSITTCTAEDEVSMIYSLDSQGHVTSRKPSHLGKGTTVCITKLFKNLPVRKQFYSTAKKCKEELKKIEDLLVAYGVIHPDIRFSLAHNKAVVWQKPRVADQRTALLRCLGTTVMGSMIPVQHQASTMQLSISGFVPKPGADPGITSSTSSDRCLLAINGRPVHYKDLLKLVRQYYRNTSPSSSTHTHYPVFFLSLSIPANTIDVNLTPDKMQVMLHNKEAILAELDEMLLQVYGPLIVQNEEQVEGMASVSSIGISCENNNKTDDPKDDMTTTLPTSLSHRSKGENTETKSITISKNTSVHAFVGENQELDKLDDFLGDCLYTSKEPNESSVSGLGHDCPIVNTNEFGLILSESVGNLATELEGIENEQPNSKDTFAERESSCDNPVGIAKSTPELTADSWSRGTWLKDSAGCPLEPVKVYTPGLQSADSRERNIFTSTGGSSFNKSPRKKTGFLDGKVVQSTAYDLLSNRAVRKPQEARQIFLKERRANLQAENPGASPEEMRVLLFDEWEQLPPELRRRYEDKATKDLENYNKQLEMAANVHSTKNHQQHGDNRQVSTPKAAARNGVHKRKMNAISPPDNQPRLDQLLLTPKSVAQAPVLPSVREVPFSLPSIRQKLQLLREYSQSQKSDDGPKPVKLLMPLGSRGAWLGQAGNSLVAINHFRLEEAMLYRRLLQNHVLPIENLGIPIPLNQSLLGSSQYLELLPSLQSETRPPDPSLYITDQRLLANGFHVRILNNGVSGEWEAELEGLATSLPYYGVSDLGEVLDAILHKHATEVEHCRPLKLVNYLQTDAAGHLQMRLSQSLELSAGETK
uniref:PMS1 protein homolog 1 isoform X2 n=1 Tax=Petromyzon marinus TaxID=7757 RepID=A0AAJ7SMQ5_PETMA|nr:PMS1 protein homolog 1 isoform X2 [Petromyzon marinus]